MIGRLLSFWDSAYFQVLLLLVSGRVVPALIGTNSQMALPETNSQPHQNLQRIFQQTYLGGGFKYFLFSSLFGEMVPIDEHIYQMGGSTTN